MCLWYIEEIIVGQTFVLAYFFKSSTIWDIIYISEECVVMCLEDTTLHNHCCKILQYISHFRTILDTVECPVEATGA
jgi:hypothetical protein